MFKQISFFALLFLLCSLKVLASVKPGAYAVASAHPLATQAGLEILKAGGNAFDAVVAVSAALAVVEPYHSSLGGGGFWLLHRAQDKKNIFIDGREMAPLAAHPKMFLDSDGHLIPGLSLSGGLAAAIPGEPAALVYIAKHYGRLPLAKSLAPAIRLAEEGFPLDHQFAFFLTIPERLEPIKKYSSTGAVFLHEGKPWERGALLKQPDLAKTLRSLAQKGHEGFYKGEIAHQLVDTVRATGGIWTLDDLAHYQIKVREPLVGAYHSMLVVTAPPPSSGGVILLTMLNILSYYPLETFNKLMWVHYLTEAMRLSYWQRYQFLGDPDFVTIPLNHLLSAENAKQLRQLIPADKALPSAKLLGEPPNTGGKNTTQISILDREGNRVAATLTINDIFGSSVIAKGTGVLLNNQMNDFSFQPLEHEVVSTANAIQPGKRPLSSMTPTFLEMPNRLAIVGAPGGMRIPTMVLLATLAFNDYFGAIKMVSEIRFHHQFLPDKLEVEPDSFSPALQAKLKAMGYDLMVLPYYYGDMQAITWDKENNFITAASDPRHIGLAATITVN